MKAAYVKRPAPAAWTPPTTLTQVPIDVASGKLATDDCPPGNVRIEYFVGTTAPVEFCPLHRRSLSSIVREIADALGL
jgi:hypothetical protein